MESLFGKPVSSETSSLFTDEKIVTARNKVSILPHTHTHPSQIRRRFCFEFVVFVFQIIEWVNKCSDGTANSHQKCEAITQIQEVLLHSDSDLLDEFIDNILSFSHDASQEVRRSVVGFIEEIR